MGFAYTVPLADTWIALTRHGAPELGGTLNGIGVLAGTGVLLVVAVTPTPTETYASDVHHTTTPSGPGSQVAVEPAVPV
jgi:hypothetical protein